MCREGTKNIGIMRDKCTSRDRSSLSLIVSHIIIKALMRTINHVLQVDLGIGATPINGGALGKYIVIFFQM